jgi:hypothetical protein
MCHWLLYSLNSVSQSPQIFDFILFFICNLLNMFDLDILIPEENQSVEQVGKFSCCAGDRRRDLVEKRKLNINFSCLTLLQLYQFL